MAFSRLRRFDVQAQYSLVLSIASTLPCIAGLWLVVGNYEPQLQQIVYGANGRFVPAFAGSMLVSSLPAALAFVFGWSSAGQRRNDKPLRSWLGFFLGGAVLTLNSVMVLAFLMLRLKLSS